MTAATVAAPATWRRGRFAPLREFGDAVATIMVKELRSRMRGRRAFVVLTLYLAVLAAIAYGAYLVGAPNARLQAQFGGFDPFGSGLNASASIGQLIFFLLSVFQLLLVAFIAPAFTSGAISLEREKQTLDLLVSTPLRPGGIVVGKLLAALAYVFLMIIAGLPLSALVLMYGGVTVDDLLRQQVVLFISAIGFGATGIFFSALVKRTQAATVLTSITMLALTIGTLLVWVFWTAMLARSDPFEADRAPDQLLWVNPAVAMSEVIANTELGGYGAFSQLLQGLRGQSPDEVICQGNVCWNPNQPVPMPMPMMPEPGPEIRGFQVDGIAVAEGRAIREFRDAAAELELRGRAAFAAIGPPPVPNPLVSSYFLTRFGVTFSGMSVALTLASMWLVVPAGMRFAFRRRRPAHPSATVDDAPGAPAIEPLDEVADS